MYIEKVDNLMRKILHLRSLNDLTDEEFATSEKIRNYALEIVEILKSKGIKTTYNNLINMNFHTLIKILNYNNFFPTSELSKKISDKLKTFPIRR